MRIWLIFFISASLILTSASLFAKSYYRYTDSNGKVVVKDYLPTEAVTAGYDIISETGRLIEKVAPALTKEQRIAEDIRQKQLEKQAASRKKERQRDTLLLRQYKTVNDIERTKNSQTGTLNINLRIVQSHTKSLERKLSEQEAKAADYERKGKAVPEMTLHEITAIKNQIAINEDSVNRYNAQIKGIEDQFAKDRIRFQELKAEIFVQNSLRDSNLIEVKDIYNCSSKVHCDKAWSYAQIFALENATHRLNIITNTLIVSNKPQADNEIALTITKVPQKNELESMNIVIKVDCYSSDKGRQLCQGPTVTALKQRFVDYLANNSQ